MYGTVIFKRAMLLAFLLALLSLPTNVSADMKLIVSKSFKGGKSSSVNPNQIIASWALTVDKVTTYRSLVYHGRTGESSIELVFRESERSVKGGDEKLISEVKIPVYLDCEGETICKVEDFGLALRVSGNSLCYTILADWDQVYLDEKTAIKQCKNGHNWVESEYKFCPVCGEPLKSKSVKAADYTATASKSEPK